MVRISAKTLHGLAEDIYEALEREGYWDDDDRSSRRASPGRRARSSTRRGMVRVTARRAYERPRKKKRKVSRYQRAFGACLKELKRAHPRTPTTRLMKKAHTCARKKRKREGW